MNTIFASHTANITELKASPTKLLKQAGNKPIAILNHNKPTAYLVPSEVYEKLLATVDDYLLAKKVDNRLNDNTKPIAITLDEL